MEPARVTLFDPRDSAFGTTTRVAEPRRDPPGAFAFSVVSPEPQDLMAAAVLARPLQHAFRQDAAYGAVEPSRGAPVRTVVGQLSPLEKAVGLLVVFAGFQVILASASVILHSRRV